MDRGKASIMIALIEQYGLPITFAPLGGKRKYPHRVITVLDGLMPQSSSSSIFENSGSGISPRKTLDAVFLPSPFTAYSNTLGNLLEALCMRIYLVKDPLNPGGYTKPPQPLPEVYDRLNEFMERLVELLDDHDLMSHAEYVRRAPAHRRPCYEIARENIRLNVDDARWTRKKEFVKLQREDGSSDSRLISPAWEEQIILEGRYVKSIEDHCGGLYSLYEAIDVVWAESVRVEWPVCTKGHNHHGVADMLWRKWIRFLHAVYVSLDCSRFSQHTGDRKSVV